MVADLGNVAMASPTDRIMWKPRPEDVSLQTCTVEYCPPDVLLGDPNFGVELDMWSPGCVGAEMYLRTPLFHRTKSSMYKPESEILDQQFALLGALPPSDKSEWMKSLPYYPKFYPQAARSEEHILRKVPETLPRGPETLPERAAPEWPRNLAIAQRLQGCPPDLADVVQKTLVWHPGERMSVASAAGTGSCVRPPSP